MAQAEFQFVVAAAVHHAFVDLPGPRQVVRVQQTLPRAHVRLHFLVGITEHLLPAWRVHDGAGFEIPVPDAFLRAGERERQSLFAHAHRAVRAPACGDVADRNLNAGILQSCAAQLGNGHAAVALVDLDVAELSSGSGRNRREPVGQRLTACGARQFDQGSVDEAGGPAQDVRGRAVGREDAIVANHDDAVGTTLEQVARAGVRQLVVAGGHDFESNI